MIKLLARPLLPFEQGEGAPALTRLKESVLVLIAVAALEVLAFTVGGIAAVVACYLWIALSLFCFAYLSREYLVALAEDARRGAFWGLLPLAAAIPLCFFQRDS
jgi:MFS-type transporter involved in bile tolerance (Atg22 family)